MLALWVFLAIISSPQSLPAATVHFSDYGITGKNGSYDAAISYIFLDDRQATLTISLTNTSKNHSAGYITALAFNNPGNRISGIVMSGTNGNFSLIGMPDFGDEIAVSPYGSFDIGASIADGPNNLWLGGNNPALGIGLGETETFTFSLAGNMLSELDELSFLEELSFPAQNRSESFAVRFRGNDGTLATASAVPLPPTVILLGTALFGLVGLRRKSS
ncbi:MAG: hypothetical protein KJ717_08250 [Proteobacteria bacterium]|nr:hypothetical protein [Pseudomonadota bacterium]